MPGFFHVCNRQFLDIFTVTGYSHISFMGYKRMTNRLRQKNFMGGKDTGQKMPESFLTDHHVWDCYISRVWTDILVFCGLEKNDSVVEIAPGASTKIGGALAALDF